MRPYLHDAGLGLRGTLTRRFASLFLLVGGLGLLAALAPVVAAVPAFGLSAAAAFLLRA